jgi:hypothetical protein
MPSNDKRIDDPNDADDYLTQWITHLDGSAQQRNLKQGQEGHVDGQINMDGEYSTLQYNENGDLSHVVQGARKTYADSKTESFTKGHDFRAAQVYHKADDGVHSESGGHVTAAVDGTHITSTSQSTKTFATGGSGLHVVEGDQSLITNSGRIDFQATDGLGILTEQGFTVSSGQDTYLTSGTNFAVVSNVNTSIDAIGSAYINSKGQLNFSGTTDVTLACGSAFTLGGAGVATALSAPAGIIMTPASIIFKVGVSQITITAAGIIINAPLISTTSSGPTTIIGSTVAIL